MIMGLTVAESPGSQGSKSAVGSVLHLDNKKTGEETPKRRKVSPFKQELESPPPADESLSAPPCLVALDPGIKITSVAAGGRHTLALSGISTPSYALPLTQFQKCRTLPLWLHHIVL